MKTWDNETWVEYETRDGLISEEEFWNYAHAYLDKLIKEKKDARSNGCASQYPFDTASLSQRTTGLPVVVIVLSGEGKPKVGFQNDSETRFDPDHVLYLSISDNPQILAKDVELQISAEQFEMVRQWVILNQNVLLAYWHCESTTDELIDNLKRL